MSALDETKELLESNCPCPFCGNDSGMSEELYKDEIDPITIWWSTNCPNCDAQGPAACTADEARRKWNER